MKKNERLPNLKNFTCEHCNKEYKTEKGLLAHYDDCRIKVRFDYMEFDSRPMEIWKIISPRYGNDKLRFAKDSNFIYIIKALSYVDNQRWLFAEDYLKWLISNKIPYVKWQKRSIYDQFIQAYLKRETPADAITRSIEYIIDIGYFGRFFEEYPPNKLMLEVETGQISPWLLVLYPSLNEYIDRLKPDQIEELTRAVNFDLWYIRAKRFPRMIDRLKKELSGVKI